MMRISLAETVHPQLVNERGIVASLRTNVTKLERQNRRLKLQVSRLESAAMHSVGDGTLEAMRRSLMAEHARERQRDFAKYRHEMDQLQKALTLMTQKVDELKGFRSPRAETAGSGGATTKVPEPLSPALEKKLAAGKMLSGEELARLKDRAKALTVEDSKELIAAKALGKQGVPRPNVGVIEAMRHENAVLRHENEALRAWGAAASLDPTLAPPAAAQVSATPGLAELGDENQRLKVLLLASEKQCSRLVAAMADQQLKMPSSMVVLSPREKAEAEPVKAS